MGPDQTSDDEPHNGFQAAGCLKALGHGLLVVGLGNLLLTGAGLAGMTFLGTADPIGINLSTFVMTGGMGAGCMLVVYSLSGRGEAKDSEFEECPARERTMPPAVELEPGIELGTVIAREGGHVERVEQQRRAGAGKFL